MPTLGEVYRQSLNAVHYKDEFKLPIRLILMHINGIETQEDFYRRENENIKDLRSFTSFFTRFLNHEPVEYIINEATFLDEKYYVDNRVLIPRVETEEVVLKAVELANKKFGGKEIQVADICSGSGVMGIAFKKKYSNSNLVFVDISNDATEVNKINLSKHNFSEQILVGNSTEPLVKNDCKVDMIISNPPYILKEEEIDKSVLDYEPHIALIDNIKFYIYKNIFEYVRDASYKPQLLVFEIGYDTKDDLDKLAKEILPNVNVSFFKDINGKDRIMVVEI